jgi:alkylation response protein AidB-like acyl-CoA dehydrogenase
LVHLGDAAGPGHPYGHHVESSEVRKETPMTVTEKATIASAADVLDAVRTLGPTISARAAEIETARRLPLDLVSAARDAGCFRLVRPASHGGIEADWPSAMRIYAELARADASAGWSILIGSAGWCDLAELPRATFDEIFGPNPDVITAGVFNPSGSIHAAGERYQVEGRWSFASGCEHADWIYGNCIEGVVDGVPQLRGAVFRPEEIVIEDTWHVSGLRGTGSHHFHVTAMEVPAAWTFQPLAGEPAVEATLLRAPIPSMFATGIAAVATGIADGALGDIVALATEKVPLLGAGVVATNPSFQLDLARADTDLRAAQALLWETAESLWARAAAGSEFSLETVARVRSAAVWATERAAEVVDAAYRLAGGSAVYADSPLQRRWRDVHAITQHFLVKRDTFATAGAILAGQDIHVPVF